MGNEMCMCNADENSLDKYSELHSTFILKSKSKRAEITGKEFYERKIIDNLAENLLLKRELLAIKSNLPSKGKSSYRAQITDFFTSRYDDKSSNNTDLPKNLDRISSSKFIYASKEIKDNKLNQESIYVQHIWAENEKEEITSKMLRSEVFNLNFIQNSNLKSEKNSPSAAANKQNKGYIGDVVQHFTYEDANSVKFYEQKLQSSVNKKNNKKNKNQSKNEKINNKIIFSVPIKDSKISKKLLINNHEIELNENLLSSINSDAVIYDTEFFIINEFKTGIKCVGRYFQITKSELKYFQSIYSQSVINDRPLFRLPLIDIQKITLLDDDNIRMKLHKIKLIFQISYDLNERNTYRNNLISQEILKNSNSNVLEIGTNDLSIGSSFYKLINYIKEFKPVIN